MKIGQNLAVKLAAAETELACLKMTLAQVKEDRDKLRQDRRLAPGRPMSGASLPRRALA
jgi:hypothetical protein